MAWVEKLYCITTQIVLSIFFIDILGIAVTLFYDL